MKTKKYGAFIVFLSSLFWAADAPFRKPLLVGGFGTGFVAFLEHIINTVVSLPILFKNRALLPQLNKKQLAGLLYIGAGASALAAILFVKGAVLMNYNFTVAALLQKFQPIFAILIAAVFLKEKIHKQFWMYAMIALVGGYLVTFGLSSPIFLLTSTSIGVMGPMLAIVAALLWAGGTVVGRSLLFGLPFEFVSAMRFLFGLVFLTFYVLLFEHMQFGIMTFLFWKNVIIIALITGFFALTIYYYGLRNTKASVATLMELGYPIALTSVNWIFLDITLSRWQVVGAGVLLVSVYMLAKPQEETVESLLQK